jgi:hypothetical protein
MINLRPKTNASARANRQESTYNAATTFIQIVGGNAGAKK